LKITVTAVQGTAQFRPTSADKWQAVKPNAELPEGVEFRTGPKGAIQFTVGTDTVYRVDRLSNVKVLRAMLSPDGTIRTDVGMNYGRVSKDVDAPQRPHEDTIVSPSSTLAVRGTRVSLYDQPPYVPEAVSLTGRAEFQNVKRQRVAFGDKGIGTIKVFGDQNSSAQTALVQTKIDPVSSFAGRTQTEDYLVLSLQTIGGTQLTQLPGVLGSIFSSGFKGSGVGALPIGEQLQFSIIWNGSPFSDVNLTVISPLGETIDAAHPQSNSSGVYGGNNVADATGFGFESTTFVISYPPGTYTVKSTLASGSTASVTANVVRDPLGAAITIGQFKDTLTPANPTASHNVAAPGTPIQPMAIPQTRVAGPAQAIATAHRR
jgi:hypothetical protein